MNNSNMPGFSKNFVSRYPALSKPEAYAFDKDYLAKIEEELSQAGQNIAYLADEDISVFLVKLFDFYKDKLDLTDWCLELVRARKIKTFPEPLAQKIREVVQDYVWERYMPGDGSNYDIVADFLVLYKRNPQVMLPILSDLFPIGAIHEDMAQDAMSQEAHWEAFFQFLNDKEIQNSDIKLLEDILNETVSLKLKDALPELVKQAARSSVAKDIGISDELLESHLFTEVIDVKGFSSSGPRPLNERVEKAEHDFIEGFKNKSNYFLKTRNLAQEMLKKINEKK